MDACGGKKSAFDLHYGKKQKKMSRAKLHGKAPGVKVARAGI